MVTVGPQWTPNDEDDEDADDVKYAEDAEDIEDAEDADQLLTNSRPVVGNSLLGLNGQQMMRMLRTMLEFFYWPMKKMLELKT